MMSSKSHQEKGTNFVFFALIFSRYFLEGVKFKLFSNKINYLVLCSSDGFSLSTLLSVLLLEL